MKYDPDVAPNSSAWRALDEAERLVAVRDYHRRTKQPRGESPDAHAAIHVGVENQLADKHPAATRAMSRLLEEGLDRHDAIHAIGSVLAGEMYQMLKTETPHDPEKYSRRLEALTDGKLDS